MYKRLIAIPLCIIFCIAVFSSSVFALTLPNNSVAGDFSLSVTASGFGSTSQDGAALYVKLKDISYGTPFVEKSYFRYSVGGSYATGAFVDYSLTISNSKTVYIMCRTAALSAGQFTYSSISSYENTSGRYTDSNTFNTPIVDYYLDRSTNSVSNVVNQGTYSETFGLTFLRFDDVPAGTYTFRDTSSTSETGWDSNYPYNRRVFVWPTIGVFIISGESVSDVVDSYIAGDSSFSDTLSNLSTTLGNSISNSATDAEKQFHASLGQFELDRLVQASNDKNMTQIQNTLVPSLNNSVNSFASGSSTLEDSLTSLNNSFGSSLDSAETPEQALLVSTQYQIALKKLEIQAQIKAKNKLDSAISDDEMSQFDSYYQTEEDIIQLFDKEEFESKLDYQTWLLQLPTTEAIQYRQFFEYILNDSPWKYFILIPMMMTLVSIVLGTRIRLRGSDEAPKSDSFTSNYSGKWDYQNRG